MLGVNYIEKENYRFVVDYGYFIFGFNRLWRFRQ